LLCIPYKDFDDCVASVKRFQFPLLGFLLCIRQLLLCPSLRLFVSIPFIGIFALHPWAFFGGFAALGYF
jgi:hypothetical protein